MRDSKTRSPKSASLPAIPEDLKTSITKLNKLVGIEDELIEHVEELWLWLHRTSWSMTT